MVKIASDFELAMNAHELGSLRSLTFPKQSQISSEQQKARPH